MMTEGWSAGLTFEELASMAKGIHEEGNSFHLSISSVKIICRGHLAVLCGNSLMLTNRILEREQHSLPQDLVAKDNRVTIRQQITKQT